MMRIIFESDLLIPSVSKAISILTDGAKVYLDEIYHDETNKIVYLPIKRKKLTGFKRLFGGEMQPVYNQEMTNSLLTIRNVKEITMKIDDRLRAAGGNFFTVLFGLRIDDNNLYLGSAEELHGNMLCQIFIKVESLSIECVDMSDS